MHKIMKYMEICLVFLLILTGCKDNNEPSDETADIFVYNNSSHEITSILVGSNHDEIEPEEVLSLPLEPGETTTITIPEYYSYSIIPSDNGNEWLGEAWRENDWFLANQDVIIISDEIDDNNFVFVGFTIDEALQQVNGSNDTDVVTDTRDINEMVKELGYDSLTDMRLVQNEYVEVYDDNEAFSDLSGYWYPEDDTNSLTYFKVERGTIYWYTFKEGIGDEETSYDSISNSILGTYHTNQGNKLVMKSDGFLSTSYLLYNDEETTVSR